MYGPVGLLFFFFCLFICLSVCLSVSLLVYHVFIYLRVCLFVYLLAGGFIIFVFLFCFLLLLLLLLLFCCCCFVVFCFAFVVVVVVVLCRGYSTASYITSPFEQWIITDIELWWTVAELLRIWTLWDYPDSWDPTVKWNLLRDGWNEWSPPDYNSLKASLAYETKSITNRLNE